MLTGDMLAGLSLPETHRLGPCVTALAAKLDQFAAELTTAISPAVFGMSATALAEDQGPPLLRATPPLMSAAAAAVGSRPASLVARILGGPPSRQNQNFHACMVSIAL